MLPTLSISLLLILVSVPAALLSLQGAANGASSQETPATAAPASPPPPPPPPPRRPPPPLGDPSWAVGLRVYRALRAPTSSSSSSSHINTVFSPLLLACSLGALGRGSGGSTSSQLRDLLKTPPAAPSSSPPPSSVVEKAAAGAGDWEEEVLSGALRTLRREEANGSSFHLHSASALFSKDAPPVDQAFAQDIKARFGVQHQPLWKGDSQADLLKQLHAWAQAGLGGPDGVPPLDAQIQAKAGGLILASALRFKGLWEREFSVDHGDKRTFLGKKYTKVPIMHRAGVYRHYEDVQNMVQVVELGLWAGRASLVLLLPFHVEALTRLDRLLCPELLAAWLDRLDGSNATTSASVSLPVANITCTLSLKEALSALGLSDAWDQKTADFSGVSSPPSSSSKRANKLHLEAVLHWASLELAPGAATGAGGLEDESVDQRPKMFYADHPFIALVRDNASGALLLMGALDHAEGEALHDEL